MLIVLVAGLLGCESSPASPADAEVADASPTPTLEVGTNEVGEDDFTVLHDGSSLPVILGGQGAYMLVVAMRASEVEDLADAHVRVELDHEDALVAKVKVKHADLTHEGDGWTYLRDIYLIVDDHETLLGTDAVLRVELVTVDDELIVVGEVAIAIEPEVR